MVVLPLLTALLALPASADEPLKDRLEREYVQPALREVLGAFEGRQPAWTPPVPAGGPKADKLSGELRARWLEPLMMGYQNYMLAATRFLASPSTFEPPPAPDFSSLLPSAFGGDSSPSATVGGPQTALFARPEDFAPRRDSTRLTRGASGASGRPRLRALPSRLSSSP